MKFPKYGAKSATANSCFDLIGMYMNHIGINFVLSLTVVAAGAHVSICFS